MQSIGNKLKKARKEKKITQEELAKGLVSRSYISQIEKDLVTPSYKVMTSLAKRLDYDLHYFFDEDKIDILNKTEFTKLIKNAELNIELNNFQNAEDNINNIKFDDFEELSDLEKGTYYWIQGEIYLSHEKWKESINILKKSCVLLQKIRDEEVLIKSLNSLAKAYLNNSNIEEAMEMLNEASNLLMKNHIISSLKIEVLLNMAICHGKIGEYKSAIRLSKEAYFLNQMTNNNYKIGEIFMTLGICYKKIGDYSNSKDYYLKAKNLFDIFNLDFNKAGTLINLGILFRESREYETALKYIESAKSIFVDLKDEYQVLNCDIETLRTYYVQGELERAKKSSFKCLTRIDSPSFLNSKYLHLKIQVLETLSDIFVEEADYKTALKYIEKAKKINHKSISKNLIIKEAKIHFKLQNFQTSATLFNSTY